MEKFSNVARCFELWAQHSSTILYTSRGHMYGLANVWRFLILSVSSTTCLSDMSLYGWSFARVKLPTSHLLLYTLVYTATCDFDSMYHDQQNTYLNDI